MVLTKPRVIVDAAIKLTPRLKALPVELIPVPGDAIDAKSVVNAQALLTRTITAIDRALLEGSNVRFVGTASAGIDHVEMGDLDALGIEFASAAGCNAAAVGDYVLAAVASCGRLHEITQGGDVGLVGYGNVGRRLGRRLVDLGARVKVYDPWLSSFEDGIEATNLEAVLACSVVSLHASLHQRSPYPSVGRIDVSEAQKIASSTLFINAGRGGLLTTAAAHLLLDKGVDLVLDTWPNEPIISAELMTRVRIATPHIAGYSSTAKNNATDFLITPLLDALGISESMSSTPALAQAEQLVWDASGEPIERASALFKVIGRVEEDDLSFRAAWAQDPSARQFERLRRNYRTRRQLEDLNLKLNGRSEKLETLLTSVGVNVCH